MKKLKLSLVTSFLLVLSFISVLSFNLVQAQDSDNGHNHSCYDHSTDFVDIFSPNFFDGLDIQSIEKYIEHYNQKSQLFITCLEGLDDEGLERAIPCEMCNRGTLQTTTDVGNWLPTGNRRPCTHGHWGAIDIEERRFVTTVWRCGTCDWSASGTSRQEFRWVCLA